MLIIIGVAGICIFLIKHISISDSGVSIELPFYQRTFRRREPPPAPTPEPGIVIETPEQTEEPVVQDVPPPEELPEQTRALYIPALLLDSHLIEMRNKALEEGVNMLVLEYRGPENPAADEDLTENAIDYLRGSDFILTALVSAEADTHPVSLIHDAYDAGFDRVMLIDITEHGRELREAAGDRPLDVWIYGEAAEFFEETGQWLDDFTEGFDLVFVHLIDDDNICWLLVVSEGL
jgi:hypothetical protein